MGSKVSIIGCGAWGITIAELLASNQHDVLVWCHSEDIAQTINDQHKVKNLDNQLIDLGSFLLLLYHLPMKDKTQP